MRACSAQPSEIILSTPAAPTNQRPLSRSRWRICAHDAQLLSRVCICYGFTRATGGHALAEGGGRGCDTVARCAGITEVRGGVEAWCKHNRYLSDSENRIGRQSTMSSVRRRASNRTVHRAHHELLKSRCRVASRMGRVPREEEQILRSAALEGGGGRKT